MEMRAIGDVDIGQDLIPPLSPLAFVLTDAALCSHCSACFSTLPPDPDPVPSTLLYCSASCASIDSSLHFYSAEPQFLSLFRQLSPPTWDDSSDLRLSLRLLHIFSDRKINCPSQGTERRDKHSEVESLERIAGLMTNRERLMLVENRITQYSDPCENSESLAEKIRTGAMLIAKARKACIDDYGDLETEKEFVLEEMALCLVLTNAVEVQDNNGCRIGVAVYGPEFSWINHSCSPNACYRFSLGQEHMEQQTPSRIAPTGSCVNGNGFVERKSYGPRVILRSIKALSKGEEVTIAYTDLLQPKEIRQAELWLKYRFNCSCQRCAADPIAYVDYALQALSAGYLNCQDSCADEVEKLIESFENAISDYLSFGDPELCSKKLENLLIHGYASLESIELKQAKSPEKLKLHPFHYISQNAYTTLASTYKVIADDLLALTHEGDKHKFEALNMYKTSVAYSLLVAGVVHHLFTYESGIVAAVANFFRNAGDSLLSLARSTLWDSNLEQNEFSAISAKCSRCCLALEPSPDENLQWEEVKIKLFNCIADTAAKVWNTLASGSGYMKSIQNPVDFSWVAVQESDLESLREGSYESGESNGGLRMDLALLGFHCLKYSVLLSSICYGLSPNFCSSQLC